MSKKFDPIWKNLEQSGIRLGSVDIGANPELKEAFQIKGHPTLWLIKDGSSFRRLEAQEMQLSKSDPADVLRTVEMFINGGAGEEVTPAGPREPFKRGANKSSLQKKVEMLPIPEVYKNLYQKLETKLDNIKELAKKRAPGLYEDVEHILEVRKNAALVLVAAGYLIGVFAGAAIGLCVGFFTTRTKPKKKEEEEKSD